MTTATEGAHAALLSVLRAALPWPVLRNSPEPQDPGEAVALLSDDEEPELEERCLGQPGLFAWAATPELAVFAQDNVPAERDRWLDALVGAIEDALARDRTLGGAVDYAEAGQPRKDRDRTTGAAAVATASIPITLTYCSQTSSG